MNILIIGAGPTGLTTALTLARAGVSCRIVEKRTEPSALSRAVGIMPATMKMLANLGAADAIVAEAMAIRRVAFHQGTRRLFRVDAPEFGPDTPTMLGLPQNRTEEILRDALTEAGGTVEYGQEVISAATDENTATVGFTDGREERFDWIIAADGIHSIARNQLGIAYPGKDLPDEWSIADVDMGDDFDPHQVSVYVANGGFFLVLPIEARRARLVSSTPDTLAAMPVPMAIENTRREAAFRISVRQAETYVRGRVLLAGDAAHCHSPVGGRGMNLGMADGYAAAQALLKGTVAEYATYRHAIGARIMDGTERGRKLITSRSAPTAALLWGAGQFIKVVPAARRRFWRGLTTF